MLIGLAVLFIGVSKAGLGGGLGMLTTPVCVLAFGLMGERPQFAVGFLLPLLIVGDLFHTSPSVHSNPFRVNLAAHGVPS